MWLILVASWTSAGHGVLHRSQIPRGIVLSVGEIIEVEIIKVEIERGRISWIEEE